MVMKQQIVVDKKSINSIDFHTRAQCTAHKALNHFSCSMSPFQNMETPLTSCQRNMETDVRSNWEHALIGVQLTWK